MDWEFTATVLALIIVGSGACYAVGVFFRELFYTIRFVLYYKDHPPDDEFGEEDEAPPKADAG